MKKDDFSFFTSTPIKMNQSQSDEIDWNLENSIESIHPPISWVKLQALFEKSGSREAFLVNISNQYIKSKNTWTNFI